MQINMWQEYSTVDNHTDTIVIRSINGVETLENTLETI